MMGCFFGCFRVKDENRPQAHLISDAVSSKRQDPLVSRNRLATLLLSEEKEESLCKDKAHLSVESPCQDSTDKELLDEAKFLKSCGTLVETPAEIRKTSEAENSKFHSWLPSTSIKKLHWEEAGSPEHKASSSISREQKLAEKNSTKPSESSEVESPDASSKTPVQLIDDDTLSSVNSEIPIVTTQGKNKSVRFECDPSSVESSKQSGFTDSCDRSKWSPYPTPLKLTDEMQTPGTVYATNLENLSNAKNPRIRSQYVYPVLNPVQDFTQWKVLKEEDSDTEQGENTIPDRTSVSCSSKSVMEHEKEAKVGENAKVDASLSQWLSSSPKDDRGQNYEAISSGRSHSRTPDADRPILGTVAAHWNDDEPSRISPKWWDGNGIPNSTNKYKEDQKVSWHATPFEERLEKALSDETLVFPRKLRDGRPIDFDEIEEGDSAVSRLQHSSHPESVVSF
ncbi:hypothetical protein BVC80_1795g29 [Macleaya cordata]|uniref:Protein JASON n=1 Tax=Macleaya cordata TaxID=56857 RepID=A0A200QPJ3_MACCD|nr:hypothetical protein BVC80_1795g29 [Macleaya cordata]